jgi:AraC family transcriptional regulator of arabinose operon
MAATTLAGIAASGRFRLTSPVGIVRCEPVWEFKPYRLVDFLLWCVLDGVGTATVAGREVRLGPGTCLLLPPGAALSAIHDPKRRLRVFYLHADFLDARGRALAATAVALPPMPVVVSDLSTLEPLARQVVQGNAAGGDAGHLRRDLALRLLLLKLHESARAPVTRSDGTRLTAALLAVRENPAAAWTVPGLAAQAGLSVSQTARRIRDLTGLSPRAFVIRARIERARRLMEESAMSLEQIAATLGYTDVYFFHRQFKAVAGVTPGRWRREQAPPAAHPLSS